MYVNRIVFGSAGGKNDIRRKLNGNGRPPRVPFRRVDQWCVTLAAEAWQTLEVRAREAEPITAHEGWLALESLSDLKQFTIFGSGKEFGDAQLGRLCKIRSLEVIFMNGYGGTEDGLAHLAKLPNLRHFGADHSPFTGTGLRALKDCPKFASLRFGGCPFNDEGMKALGELTQLKEANISHVSFTSTGFPHFAKLANLEKLTISPNYSPSYIGADFVHLSGLKNLQTLVVSEMALPYEDGLSHLKGLKLKRLELHDCRVSDGDLEKIKADLSGATIERIYSIDEKFKSWDRQMEKRTKPK